MKLPTPYNVYFEIDKTAVLGRSATNKLWYSVDSKYSVKCVTLFRGSMPFRINEEFIKADVKEDKYIVGYISIPKNYDIVQIVKLLIKLLKDNDITVLDPFQKS